jgi:prepilin-type N-terminal cleavage/methylation domain-containing protein
MKYGNDIKGFTLIEVVIVIVIAAILATVAVRSAFFISETAKEEETKQELEQLHFAIIGNPLLYNDNTRADFGYVGDVGAMPANLDALFSNPGGYATWKGPYIKRRFEQNIDDYKQDAWGALYTYSGNSITSTGSGTNIVREFGANITDFLLNGVDGVVLDRNGTPPGTVYRDSIAIRLTLPNGSGGYTTLTTIPDIGGFFSFESVPIGNHDIEIIYGPINDTLKRFVSIVPSSRHYGEYFLSQDVWYDTTGS